MYRRLLTYPVLVIVFILSLLPLARSKAKVGTPKGFARPKLILILVIDQFRYDYLARFRPYFVERGFNLLLSGASFSDCRFDYATTSTGPGHATLLTGAYPNLHGIIANEWYDRSVHRMVYCVEDPSTKTVGAEGPGASPRNLIGSTLGDELRFASDFESKVVAISLKERSAVISGGHTANAAYWYDPKTARFVSSTYYMQALPPWAVEFNHQSWAKAYCGKSWQALPETPGGNGKTFKEFKPTANEPCPDQKFLDWLESTPFMNEIELSFAREAVKNERLGQGPTTDLLIVALTVNDTIGHIYGPYGPGVADTTLWTDRYLADFFTELDRMVGLDKVWIVLSADHGVAPNFRSIEEQHLSATEAQPGSLRGAVNEALSQAFGEDAWVESISQHYNIFLSRATLRKRHVDEAKAEASAAQAAAQVPGVMAAFTRTQLLTGNLPDSPLSHKASNSFSSQRSGDVFVIFEPYASPTLADKGTTHGSAWNYDTHVPLVLWGSAFRPGAYDSPCQPIDLAPTLAVALGLSHPSVAQGHPLAPALKAPE